MINNKVGDEFDRVHLQIFRDEHFFFFFQSRQQSLTKLFTNSSYESFSIPFQVKGFPLTTFRLI